MGWGGGGKERILMVRGNIQRKDGVTFVPVPIEKKNHKKR